MQRAWPFPVLAGLALVSLVSPGATVAVTLLRVAKNAGNSTGGNGTKEEEKASCGPKPSYANARPKNYEDAREERYDKEIGAKVPVTFSVGDTIEFECLKGFSTDGSKNGSKVFKAECSEHGYYKPDGVCVEASKCGAVPHIPHAEPTGNAIKRGDGVEMKCLEGYSLDGATPVEGGFGENVLFDLVCDGFSGLYKEFTGECKPHAFLPASEHVRVYNEAFKALFIVSCKGTIRKAFAKGEEPSFSAACAKISDASAASQCAGLVARIKGEFQKELSAREEHDKAQGDNWYNITSDERPDIGDEAHSFCTDLWDLIEIQGGDSDSTADGTAPPP